MRKKEEVNIERVVFKDKFKAKIELIEKTIKNGMLGNIISSLMISKQSSFFKFNNKL